MSESAKHQWELLSTSIEKKYVSWCHKCGAVRVKALKIDTDKASSHYVTWYYAMGTKAALKHSPPCYPVELHEECQGLAVALETAIAKLEKAESDNAFLRNELKELMPPL
jgi:hypothetical protein